MLVAWELMGDLLLGLFAGAEAHLRGNLTNVVIGWEPGQFSLQSQGPR